MKPKDVKSIPISSQNADDTYNKESARRKMKDMGASDLIMRKFYRGDDDAS